MSLRQKILILYSQIAALDAPFQAWAIYDGSGQEVHQNTANPEPPYSSVLDAMKDGWRVIQFPNLQNSARGEEYDLGVINFEYVLEKMIEVNDE